MSSSIAHPDIVGVGRGDGSSGSSVPTVSSTQILSSRHSDYVHHIAFDVYGRRMATCSGDRNVRVWDLQVDGSWLLRSEWKAHRGTVNHLNWCHPEFGTLLATCGSDQDVKLWEERTATATTTGAPNSTNPSPSSSASSKPIVVWTEKARFADARRYMTAVEFAPRHLGLQLATASADGLCRIYEAVDLMNLQQWPLQGSIAAFDNSHSRGGAGGSGGGIQCLSWCTGRLEAPTIVLGGTTHLVIWRYQAVSRQWQPLLGFPKHPGPVLDVHWAPNVGRRFHWIAAAEQGGPLRIYQLQRGSNQHRDGKDEGKEEEGLYLESTQEIDPPGAVWRCQWNVTGTVLATSGDGGKVQLWKSDYEGRWKCVSQVQGSHTETTAMEE